MNLGAAGKLIADIYEPAIIENGRASLNGGFYKMLFGDPPAEPEGLSRHDLAMWYLDVLGAPA